VLLHVRLTRAQFSVDARGGVKKAKKARKARKAKPLVGRRETTLKKGKGPPLKPK